MLLRLVISPNRRQLFYPRTGYTYDEAVELFWTRFLNGTPPRRLLGAPVRLEELCKLRRHRGSDREIGRALKIPRHPHR